MRTLTALSAIYLASASVFGAAIVYQRNPEIQSQARWAGAQVWPQIQRGAAFADERAVKPATAKLIAWDKQFFDYIDPPRHFAQAKPVTRRIAAKLAPKPVPFKPIAPVTVSPPVVVAAIKPPPAQPVAPALRPTIAESHTKVAVAAKPAPLKLAPQAATPSAPDLALPAPAEIRHVMQRLKDNLTREMLSNFDLFLYISKADAGPLAQHMYVFRKDANGNLGMLYDWPVSTGRELIEYAPNGEREPSFTPKGYYELDPDRMYRHHFSGQWRQPMPYAMFFNWERDGLQTGLAIHGASGDDIASLGRRASAGCVRLAPEHAALLFNLIKTQYRGLAPRFAYDRRTATMSNDGLLMHDAQGRVQLADGYKVLVFIENYGGENVVAAVF